MPHPGPAIVNDGFAARLALVYAALFLAVGWYLPLFPVWLSAQGLDPGAIGFVLAAFQFTRIVGDAGRHAAFRPLRHAEGRHRSQRAGDRRGAPCRRQRKRLSGDPRRRDPLFAHDRADHAADRRVCAQGLEPARAALWTGAAVGLGRVHRGDPDRRRAARRHRADGPDLADLCRQLPGCRRHARARSASARRERQRRTRAGHSHLRSPAFLAIAAAGASSRQATRSTTASRRSTGAPRVSAASPSASCGRSASRPRSCCSRSRRACRGRSGR